MQFLQESQLKDHELFERLAKKEAERELRSQKAHVRFCEGDPKNFYRRQLIHKAHVTLLEKLFIIIVILETFKIIEIFC